MQSELRGVYNRYKDTPRAHGGRNSGRVYVNIYATVILFSQHHPTNGTDRTMAISLIDETTCGGDDPVDKPPIILNVFVKNVEDFPQIRQVGDILRMHRVGIDVSTIILFPFFSVGFFCSAYELALISSICFRIYTLIQCFSTGERSYV